MLIEGRFPSPLDTVIKNIMPTNRERERERFFSEGHTSFVHCMPFGIREDTAVAKTGGITQTVRTDLFNKDAPLNEIICIFFFLERKTHDSC